MARAAANRRLPLTVDERDGIVLAVSSAFRKLLIAARPVATSICCGLLMCNI